MKLINFFIYLFIIFILYYKSFYYKDSLLLIISFILLIKKIYNLCNINNKIKIIDTKINSQEDIKNFFIKDKNNIKTEIKKNNNINIIIKKKLKNNIT